MKKTNNLVAVVVFLAVLFAVPIVSVLLPRESMSAYENRELAVFPQLSVQSLFDGSFVEGVEDYLTDHIAGRNKMLEAYVRINRDVLNKPVVNGIYESEEGTLLDHLEYDQFDPEAVELAIESKLTDLADLNELVSSYGGSLLYVGASEQRRDRYDQYPDYLRPGTRTIDYSEQLLFDGLAQRGVNAVNMYDVFTQLGGQDAYYSKVDHHYTFDGARVTYETIMDTINAGREEPLAVLREGDLVFHEVEEPYYGSYNRKIFNLQKTKEPLVWAQPKDPVEFTRYDFGEEVEPTVFTPREGYASYSSYMNGDIGETLIDTGREELPNVLIYGDSFTNPVEGLLYYSFNEMRSLDMRHYSDMNLFEYVELHKPDYVVILRDRMQFHQTAGNGTFR